MTIKPIRLVYDPEMDIRNVDALGGSGRGCRYLLCIRAHEDGVLIAKSWHRKLPLLANSGEVSIDFKRIDQPRDPKGYATRVSQLQAEGLTNSDAQGVADMEFDQLRKAGE